MKAQDRTTGSLTPQQQSLISISGQTVAGNLDRLKVQLNKGMDAGLTINEIKEALVQLYAYCGFPGGLNALNTFKIVSEERNGKLRRRTWLENNIFISQKTNNYK